MRKLPFQPTVGPLLLIVVGFGCQAVSPGQPQIASEYDEGGQTVAAHQPVAHQEVAHADPSTSQPASIQLAGLEMAVATQSAPFRLTLEEAKSMALANNKMVQLTALQIQEKRHAFEAAQADFLPKVVGVFSYFHLDDDLGTVLTAPERPLLGIPATARTASVVGQDNTVGSINIVQPITQLLKIREVVNIADADVQISEAQSEKARREIGKAIEQLYVGLLASKRGLQGAEQAAGAAAKMAQGDSSAESRAEALQAQQGVLNVRSQVADLSEQLNSLLDLPLDTELVLSEPSPAVAPVASADEAVAFALASNPDVAEAAQNLCKAEAALRLAKTAYVPDVTLIGSYVNQNDAVTVIQENFGAVGVTASMTLFEWGKKRKVLNEREMTLALAQKNLAQTEDKIRLAVLKAYRDFHKTGQELGLAQEMVELRSQSLAHATAPAAVKTAAQAQMQAQGAYLQAEVAHRTAYTELMALIPQ